MIRILVPLDGSPAAEKAIPHAASIARAFSAEVELLGVVDQTSGSFAAPINSLDWQLSKLQTEVYLSRTASILQDKGVRASWELREGDPAQAIIQFARNTDTDILVMTRYGNGNAQQFRMGGTVQKVLSAAIASIMLIDPTFGFDEARGYARVAVAVDGSQCSEWASAFAAVVAQAFDGSLRVVRIVEEPRLPGGTPITIETRRFLEHIRRIAKSRASLQVRNVVSTIPPNVETSSSVVITDNVSATIERAAAEARADLIVVAAQDKRPAEPIGYGAMCDTLLMQAHRPLLVLRSEAAVLSPNHFRSVYLDEAEAHADVV
jgi:nucleotide-binding universal stress UspA family protein